MASLLIDLPSELERRLEEIAQEQRRPVQDMVRNALEALVATSGVTRPRIPPLSPEERAARVDAAVGVLAHLPGSVDDFLRQKQEEIDLEEENWQRRQRGP